MAETKEVVVFCRDSFLAEILADYLVFEGLPFRRFRSLRQSLEMIQAGRARLFIALLQSAAHDYLPGWGRLQEIMLPLGCPVLILCSSKPVLADPEKLKGQNWDYLVFPFQYHDLILKIQLLVSPSLPLSVEKGEADTIQMEPYESALGTKVRWQLISLLLSRKYPEFMAQIRWLAPEKLHKFLVRRLNGLGGSLVFDRLLELELRFPAFLHSGLLAKSMSRVRPSRRWHHLVDGMMSSQPKKRLFALSLISRPESSHYRSALTALSRRDPERMIRHQAILALAGRLSPALRRFFLKQLAGPSLIAYASALSLARSVVDKDVPLLCQTLAGLQNQRPLIQKILLSKLALYGHFPEVRHLLLARLRSASPEIRWAAARALELGGTRRWQRLSVEEKKAWLEEFMHLLNPAWGKRSFLGLWAPFAALFHEDAQHLLPQMAARPLHPGLVHTLLAFVAAHPPEEISDPAVVEYLSRLLPEADQALAPIVARLLDRSPDKKRITVAIRLYLERHPGEESQEEFQRYLQN